MTTHSRRWSGTVRWIGFGCGELRDAFWRAFWRRQKKYLPPAAQITISNVHAHVDAEAKVPAFNIDVGRRWGDLHG